MTKTCSSAGAIERTGNRQHRKPTIWTRERIAQLIKLYRQHECLWNHFISSYKSKECRTRAIEDICKTLGITKFDFGKKIHNLRNQFNSEMKKLERRIEMGGDAAELNATGQQRCKWEHFESLMFLRNVIEHRPAGFQSMGGGGGGEGADISLPQHKKMRLKYDYTDEDAHADEQLHGTVGSGSGSGDTTHVTEYHIEETTTGGEEEEEATLAAQIAIDDFQNYEEVEAATEKEDYYDDKKYNPPTQHHSNNTSSNGTSSLAASTPSSLPAHTSRSYKIKVQKQDVIQLADATQHLPTGSVIELPSGTTLTHTSVSRSGSVEQQQPTQSPRRLTSYTAPTLVARDQWDAFGELISNELRNLNSETSRKRLKRKIMQAMLEVGAEDDELSVNTAP